MEVTEKICEGETTSKTPPRADASRSSHARKRKGEEVDSPTNPEKGRAGNHKTRNAGYTSDRPTRGKCACCMAPGTIQKSVNY